MDGEKGITYPKGFIVNGVACGIKKSKKKDLALLFSETACQVAACFTTNAFQAAPILVNKKHIVEAETKALLINSGVANACMGESGLLDALKTAELVAGHLEIRTEEVLVSSTGLIGVRLPVEKIGAGLTDLVSGLRKENNLKAAQAIMTTDTKSKEISKKIFIKGREVRLGAMAKGSGMIHPNMATMLAFLTSDIKIDKAYLDKTLKKLVQKTFNMISVDGDTSTNDMVLFLANGLADNEILREDDPEAEIFEEALEEICCFLAKRIAEDGEGATKLLEVEIRGALSLSDARRAAKAICSSNLVKAAIFGEDANWGRVITALGYSGASLDPLKVDIFLEDMFLAKDGKALLFSEEEAREILEKKEVKISLDLKLGDYTAKAWGCDLTYDYVRINGQYRS